MCPPGLFFLRHPHLRKAIRAAGTKPLAGQVNPVVVAAAAVGEEVVVEEERMTPVVAAEEEGVVAAVVAAAADQNPMRIRKAKKTTIPSTTARAPTPLILTRAM
jgi:hypothetical protein